MLRHILNIGLVCGFILFETSLAIAQVEEVELDSRVYDEYETRGGESNAFGGAGASIVSKIASIRINPAGLATGRVYSIEAGYHKPSFGDDFYQIGIVDNKTSSVAAGFLYTDFRKSVYKRLESSDDAPVKRRFSLGLATALNEVVAFGVGANYTMAVSVEGLNEDGTIKYERKKGITAVNPGVLVKIGSSVKLGLSAENLFRKSLKDYNPRFYRFGSSYLLDAGNIQFEFNLDYRGRERILEEKLIDKSLGSLEHMVFVGTSITSYEIVKLMLSYGKAVKNDDRTSLGFGLSLKKNDSYISVSCLYPYFNFKKQMHTSVHLSYAVVI